MKLYLAIMNMEDKIIVELTKNHSLIISLVALEGGLRVCTYIITGG